MAEGGGEFGYEDPDIDNWLDHDDDDDDDDDDEQEVNRTQPFQPGASSTPYHRGEKVEMQTMQHEQSGLPETAGTAPLFGKRNVTDEEIEKRLERLKRDSVTGQLDTTDITSENPLSAEDQKKEIDNLKAFILKRYEQADVEKLVIRFSSNPKKPMDIVVLGPRGGETKILLDNGKGFSANFLNKTFVKNALGPKTEEIIQEDRASVRELRSYLKATEKQVKKTEQLYYQMEKDRKEVEILRGKKQQAQSRLDEIHDVHGSDIEMESEANRLRQLIKNYETEVKNKNKEIASMEKQVKNNDKLKAKLRRISSTLTEKESKINSMEERLNQTKQLDDLKEQESELQRQNAEDLAIIQDENASPSDMQAAEGRVAERNEELARLQTQIAERERERTRPLFERVKEIFKKYGVTVTAVLLAASVTIGAVVGTITNALKATGRALGKGLKDIGAKLGSLLPGLIGSIVSFLFKAADQAVGFLAEHAWLLILAVVAFLFEKYLKKRR